MIRLLIEISCWLLTFAVFEQSLEKGEASE